MFSIYRPPKQNINYLLKILSEGFDFYSKHYENICILGDFNAAPSNPHLTLFLENQNLKSMIKNPTCFKSSNGSAVNLILTNNSYLYAKNQSFEKGISDHHHLICTMSTINYERMPPKTITYRSYKNFAEEQFKEANRSDCSHTEGSKLTTLQHVIEKKLDQFTPIKKIVLRGSNKPRMTSQLRKTIMKRSQPKNKANKSGKPADNTAYKAQKNLSVVK